MREIEKTIRSSLRRCFPRDGDFKVCGSREGVTALQMDIKIQGLSRTILEQALEQAKRGRMFILGKMAMTTSMRFPRPVARAGPQRPRGQLRT